MNKPKLIFAARWDRIKERTWSGTTFALFSELEKYYEVESFDLKESLGARIKRKVNKIVPIQIFHEDFQIKLLKQVNKKFIKKYGSEELIVFQFTESPRTNYTYNFIFQDLCVSSVYDLKKTEPEIFALTEFNNFSEMDMLKRIKSQQEFYKNCSAVFTMGEWMRDYIIKNCNVPANKIFAVGGGINIERDNFEPSGKNRKRFLFVGRNFERKGGQLVVEAFKKLRKIYVQDAELYIAGPQNNRWEGIDGITFLGDIDSSELIKYYNLCDVFCMPSHFEAYGLVFGEALCYGLPCIARNKYSMSEFIKDGINGYLIDSDDINELCEKMRMLIQNDKIFEYVMAHRDCYVKEYSWENVGKKINEVIKEKVKINEF